MVTEVIAPSITKSTTVNVDGLGREWYTMLTSGPQGTTYTQQTYDGLGRKYQVWNPKRCNPVTSNSCPGETTWGITTFQYDALSRPTLTISLDGKASANNNASMDPWGNLYQTSGIPGTSLLNPMPVPSGQTATGMNQLASTSVPYVYAGGDTTSIGPNAYSYDGENRITSAAAVTYTYNRDGERVGKSSGTLYWGSGPLAESNSSGAITSEFIFLNGKRIARRDVGTGNVYYYLSDHLGSSNVVVNATGIIHDESDRYPYGGESRVADNLTPQHYKFTGKQRDAESGLDYFGARYYASNMGRWMSPDWADKPEAVPYSSLDDPQSLNLYGYVRNNPLSRADADGHEDCCLDFIGGAAKGAFASLTGGAFGSRPSSSDSPASLQGQLFGTAGVAAAGIVTDLNAAGAVGGGLILAPETGGLSLTVSAAGVAEGVVGTAMIAGASANASAVTTAWLHMAILLETSLQSYMKRQTRTGTWKNMA